MGLIDSHAHLDLSEFNTDRDAVIKRARTEGVVSIVTIGIGLEECRAALQIAQQWPFVYAALGIHPHNAGRWSAQVRDFLEHAARQPKVVALGEIGLDFYRNRSSKEDQRRCFRDQIGLAKSLKLPVIIHDREAHRETLDIVREEHAGEYGGVFHCFSGDAALARKCIDLGFYISIPGTVTFRNASLLHEVVRAVPLEYLLIETDCPFLTPVPFRGKRNEPAYVRYVAEAIAALKQLPLEEVAYATTKNTKRLFRLSGDERITSP
ncbi:MAG: TatD family hydrolase [Desulfobacterota bacterium]|nr:TatD family hydrolase [Thermodesulfobacteriota bacterium]